MRTAMEWVPVNTGLNIKIKSDSRYQSFHSSIVICQLQCCFQVKRRLSQSLYSWFGPPFPLTPLSVKIHIYILKTYTDIQFVTNFSRIKCQNNLLPKKHMNYDKLRLKDRKIRQNNTIFNKTPYVQSKSLPKKINILHG